MPGYQHEPGVAKDSITETYIAAKLFIDNWRWRGVPFYLRTGKRLARQSSLIALRLRHPPQQLFRETPLENMTPNWILLSIQPDESMHLEIHAKQPGQGMHTRVIQMNAGYRQDHEGMAGRRSRPQVLGTGAGLHSQLRRRRPGTGRSQPPV